MADKKISALTSASTPLAGTEVFPLVQGGSTVKTPVNSVINSNLTASFGAVTATVSGVPAITAIRDLDVGVVGAAGQTIALGAKSGTTPTAGADILGILEGGATTGRFAVRTLTSGSMSSKLSVSSAGDVTADLGNLVIGTAGKGIDFSANTHAAGMTSELLNDYEEGTWTPSLGGDATYSTRLARYVKIGKQVTVSFVVQVNVIGTGSTTTLSGLPYAVGSSNQYHNAGSLAYFDTLNVAVTSIVPRAVWTTSTVDFTVTTAATVASTTTAAIFKSGAYVIGNITYLVD